MVALVLPGRSAVLDVRLGVELGMRLVIGLGFDDGAVSVSI